MAAVHISVTDHNLSAYSLPKDMVTEAVCALKHTVTLWQFLD